MRDWKTFLITGPEEKLKAFADLYVPIEFFDRRGQTIRCRAHSCKEGDYGEINFQLAVEAAKAADVTMQDLVHTGQRNNPRTHLLGKGATVTVSDCVEEYPVIHLGSHGMKWGK